uniref:Uncharacterized protein n=1 Tax=Rhizophagus irregularis (strain DAOM 181602 / DAOM 197198 / MUCL 43194) TaxID=747089 RepID=U9T354_RHIID
MTSSVEKGSQFESYVYNKLKSTKLCVSRTSGRELEANRGPIDYMSPYYSKAFIVVVNRVYGVRVEIENGYTHSRTTSRK